MARVTEAAVVAHGQPGDPAPLQRDIDDLAVEVMAELGAGWVVHGATLACGCSVRRAARARLVYPLFMAEGWFTQTELPRRLAMAGAEGFAVLRPLGLDPGLPAIGAASAREAASAAGLHPAATTLVIAGHGSQKSRGSERATRAFADALAGQGWARIEAGFIEEAPFLSELQLDGPAVCLPFFATGASHTTDDIPEAWSAIGAPGPIAPPIGTAPAVPSLIAAALRAAAAQEAA